MLPPMMLQNIIVAEIRIILYCILNNGFDPGYIWRDMVFVFFYMFMKGSQLLVFIYISLTCRLTSPA